jgi:protein-S-isoprenylcysteine O-methyltransferase Ste14
MIKVVIMAVVFLTGLGVVFFATAGRLDWPMGWAYLGILAAVTAAIVARGDHDMLRLRAGRERGVKRWDPFLAGGSALLFWAGSNLVAALDYGRFQWSPPLPLPIRLAALLAFAAGGSFAAWAMVANKFFAKFVEIQKERGHAVIAHGPYAYVRHPGYAGTVVAFFALPVALGSLWALLPAVVGLTLLVVRTFLEDRTLQRELEGYSQYAKRTRYRLFPGVW